MKLLTLIVHTNVQQDVTDLLRSIKQVPGFTFTNVAGHGIETEHDAFVSAHDNVVGSVPRIRIDIRLEDDDVDTVLAAVSAEKGIAGQGIYWVTPVEKGGRLQ